MHLSKTLWTYEGVAIKHNPPKYREKQLRNVSLIAKIQDSEEKLDHSYT